MRHRWVEVLIVAVVTTAVSGLAIFWLSGLLGLLVASSTPYLIAMGLSRYFGILESRRATIRDTSGQQEV